MVLTNNEVFVMSFKEKTKKALSYSVSELKRLKVKNFIFLLVAGIVNAIGVTMFIAPVNLYDSGISGTSILLSQQTGLTLSVFLLILNIPLFLFGLKKQGVVFTVYSIFTVSVYSICAWLINDVLPIEVTSASPLAEQDLLLCALFGGIISGLGSGIAIRFGGAMDGIEVLAVIFSKKMGITVGTFVMCYNVILYIICGFAIQSWILPLYSIVTYMAGIKAVDFVVEGFDSSKSAMIVTEHPQHICEALSAAFETGITTYQAKGYYSGSDKTVVCIILNRFQIGRMKEVVHSIDSKAYISITEVSDIYSSNHE